LLPLPSLSPPSQPGRCVGESISYSKIKARQRWSDNFRFHLLARRRDVAGAGSPGRVVGGRPKDLADRFPNGITAEFKKFYYDTAFSEFPSALAPLRNLVPVTQIVFGTDFPFYTSAETANGLVNFGFIAAELAAIDRNNAVKLIPGLA